MERRGDEKQETQAFWLSFLQKVYGVAEPEKYIRFEVPVKLDHTSFIDGLISTTRILIEQKGRDIDLRKGYKKSDGSMLTPFQNKLVVDEKAARTVEMIFSLRIQGLCNSAIADRLNDMGVLSPMEYKRAQGTNYGCGFRSNEQALWSPMLIKRILSNEIYIGTLMQHKSGTPNHKVKSLSS